MKKSPANKYITILIAITISALSFVGCENNSAGSIAGPDAYTNTQTQPLNKPGINDVQSVQYPLNGSNVSKFFSAKNEYRGTSVDLVPTNSVLSFPGGSLTPPPDFPWGNNITITMSADLDTVNNELVFTFGPHGCQFSTPAQIKLDFSVLNTNTPRLFYIEENGNRVEQQPAQIDTQGRWMIIYVNHFSRYALIHG